MDNISINTIITSFKFQEKNLNLSQIDKLYRTKYKQKLSSYNLLHPSEFKLLNKGDVIIYSKKNDKLSCSSIILDIIYENNVIDYLIVMSVGYKNKTWRIHPHYYYIFKYDRDTNHNFMSFLQSLKL